MNPRRILAAGVAALALAAPVVAAERAPVYAQVTAPHSYYWREMYIPQLTSGPSSLAWAPDGTALYFSMQGRIWRRKLDATRAEEITAAAGYDYQPDVSPDGKTLIFSRREGDAINLVLRDLRSGRETPLTEGAALNLDARWSPDGTKIAYVTTAESGNFHIAIAERKDGSWTHRRWRPETRSGAGRYYYAESDHELSPAWSPDGTTLVFVSNENVLHGTGRILRQQFDLSAPAEIIRDEETNWKARPEFSPDGKRLSYSSYYGRQWHQLWMTTAAPGGIPMQYTYGDFDVTAARWSPNGTKIAFVSNEAGGLHLEILDVVGGARHTLEQTELKRTKTAAPLALRIVNEAGAVTAARVSVRAKDGRDYAPEGALIRADDYRDPARAIEAHYFHSDGDDVIMLPPGEAEIRVWRGLSSLPVMKTVNVPRGGGALEITLDDLGADFADWKSGDVHTHMNYGGAYRETVEGYARQADAEALDLAFNLIVNKEQRIPDIGAFTPVPARPEGAHAVIAQAQEFHTSIWGHLGLLGLDDHVLITDYVGYPKTAVASLYPDNATVATLAHEQSALVGYVHPYDPPAPDPKQTGRFSHSLPADVALGLVDYLEVVGFSDHRITEGVWHRLLNCGFRLPAAGGTDAMTNYASLRGPIGLNRTFVDLREGASDDPAALTRAWLDGLKAGKSFATNSALLKFEIAGTGPGGDIKLSKGAHTLKYSARMESIAAVKSLEVIVNGAVAATLPLTDDGKSARAEGEITIEKSGWISLRAASDEASPDVFDLYPYAVTSPIYVTVDGKPARSREDADYFIAWIDRLIDHAAKGEFNTDDEREIVIANFRKARKEFEKRR
ncbi:MAG: CehA/McbA family metallohydrolase [Parvularculaceae bacterium]|nr:CehA/McbA family metallohydrolase [Parvularculaceae bacterium]